MLESGSSESSLRPFSLHLNWMLWKDSQSHLVLGMTWILTEAEGMLRRIHQNPIFRGLGTNTAAEKSSRILSSIEKVGVGRIIRTERKEGSKRAHGPTSPLHSHPIFPPASILTIGYSSQRDSTKNLTSNSEWDLKKKRRKIERPSPGKSFLSF